MTAPDTWNNALVMVLHLMPRASVIASAMPLGSDELGLRLAIEATVGEWYRVEVAPGPVVKLRRRAGGQRA